MNHPFSLLRMAQGLWLLTLVFSSTCILFHLDPTLIDLAGHLASAKAFSEGLHHQFSDSFFLGNTHGLFYPPLEDLILAGIALFTGFDWWSTLRIYLALLVLSTLWSWQRLLPRTNPLWYFFGTLASIGFYLFHKGSLYFQGLSLQDLLITGLSSQTLGGIFLALLVYEVEVRTQRHPLRWKRTATLAALCVLAHLVVGLIAALLLLVLTARAWLLPSFRHERSSSLRAGALALLLSSYFWLPFLLHHSHLTTSKIIAINRHKDAFFPWAALHLFSLLAWSRTKASVALLTATLVLAVNLSMILWPELAFGVPSFHYYRLDSLGCFLFLTGTFMHPSSRIIPLLTGCGVVAWILFYGEPVRTLNALTRIQNLNPPSAPRLAHALDAHPPRGRTWIIGPRRSVDSGHAALAYLLDSRFQSSQGLFWESSRTNSIYSSYLATLLSPPGVLDYSEIPIENCEVYSCLLEQMVRRFTIERIYLTPRPPLPASEHPVLKRKAACFQSSVLQGTKALKFTPEGSVQIGNREFHSYRATPLDPKGGDPWALLEVIDPYEVHALDETVPPAHGVITQDTFFCEGQQPRAPGFAEMKTILDLRNHADEILTRKTIPNLETFSAEGAPRPAIQKLAPGEYRLELDSTRPRYYLVKIAPLNGWKAERVLDSSPNPNLFTYPRVWTTQTGVIVFGQGQVRLRKRGVFEFDSHSDPTK